jgi:O-antigen/teichoic acid export membrane protein/GT2 family glycosyltransferase
MTNPTISVFLPCFNAHAYLPRALDSLRAQSFRDFEIIIINDGSTDPETIALLDSLPDDIRVVHQENRGLAGARNRGFREARADLILPLDCDDWLAPEFLADALATLESEPGKHFVFADLKLEGEADGVLHKPFNLFEQLYFNQLPYCMLMPRAAWEEIGGYDETMRLGYEDWEYNIRLGLHGWIGLPLGKPHFHYHVSATGMLASTSRARHVELWRYIRDKHAQAYSAAGLIRHWRTWRRHNSARPLIFYWVWELLFHLLPERLLTQLFQMSGPLSHSARERRRLRRAERPPRANSWNSFYTALLRRSAVPAAMVPALFSRIAAYLTLIVAARIMIPEEFGAFAVLTVLGGVINALVSGGGDMWLNRFVTRDDVARSHPPAVWPLYLTISLFVSTVAMISMALVVVFVPALAPQAGAILMTVLAFSLAGMSESLLAMMRATGRTVLFFGVRDIFVPLTVLALLLLWRPEDAIGFFAILAAVWAVILLALFAYALLAERWKAGKGWARKSLIPPVVKHTELLMLTNLGSRAANYIDVMVLLFFVGLADLGEYRIAAQFAIGFIVVQHFVFLSLPYQLRNVGTSGERALSQQRLRESQRTLIVIAALAFVFVLVLAEWLLSFLGARFVESAFVVKAMFLIRFLELLWGPQHEILISNGLVRFEVAASVAGIAAWLLTFAASFTQFDPITAGVIATGLGVHTGHMVRAATLTTRDIYCPRILPLRAAS